MTQMTQINYKDYPEFMFAIVAAYLPVREGFHLRRVAGNIIFRHVDTDGNTYKNGVLHSYNDLPAIRKEWYKDGELHRDGDMPAIIESNRQVWYKNGKIYREGDNPAIIFSDTRKVWYRHG